MFFYSDSEEDHARIETFYIKILKSFNNVGYIFSLTTKEKLIKFPNLLFTTNQQSNNLYP